jgi:hypothetical protein
MITCFLQTAKCDISLTPEFYDPLGPRDNWSFEIENHGWQTNNGGQISTAYALEGSHSWYTSGGGDYYMWRDVERINAIAEKTILFSFWIRPNSAGDEARAEIYFEYTKPQLSISRNSPYGSTDPPLGTYDCEAGEQVTATATPYQGKVFNCWVVDGVSQVYQRTITVTMNKDHSLYACFAGGGGGGGDPIPYRKPGPESVLEGTKGGENQYKSKMNICYEPATPGVREDATMTACGTWVSLLPGIQVGNWCQAYVKAILVTQIYKVTVKIHGKTNFHAYVDYARLSICTLQKAESSYGKFTLGLSIHEWRINPSGYGQVWFTPVIYAENSSDQYAIRSTEIKVQPMGGFSATGLTIQDDSCSQKNDRGIEIDPAIQEILQLQAIDAIGDAISFGMGIAVAFGFEVVTMGMDMGLGATAAYCLVEETVGTVVDATIEHVLCQFSSDPNVKSFQNTGYVLENWQYPTTASSPNDFVRTATGEYIVDWTFNPSSSNWFKVKITATIHWGQPSPFLWFYVNNEVATTTLTEIITIFA